LTIRYFKPIVVRVKSNRFSIGGRTTALLALSALLIVLLGATAGFAADDDAGGEACVGCAGCEGGECGEQEGGPFTSHHHCCVTCCMSHAAFALPTAVSSPAAPIAAAMPTCVSPAVTGRSPDTPFRPPRV
jgi:hypothetical protein